MFDPLACEGWSKSTVLREHRGDIKFTSLLSQSPPERTRRVSDREKKEHHNSCWLFAWQDASILYKYINPNLLAIASEDDQSSATPSNVPAACDYSFLTFVCFLKTYRQLIALLCFLCLCVKTHTVLIDIGHGWMLNPLTKHVAATPAGQRKPDQSYHCVNEFCVFLQVFLIGLGLHRRHYLRSHCWELDTGVFDIGRHRCCFSFAIRATNQWRNTRWFWIGSTLFLIPRCSASPSREDLCIPRIPYILRISRGKN